LFNKKITIKKTADISPTYVLSSDEKVVWEGLDLKRQITKIKKENPDAKITISWKSKEDFLIV
jgi:hypothetical protein